MFQRGACCFKARGQDSPRLCLLTRHPTPTCIRRLITSRGYVTVCATSPETPPKTSMRWTGSFLVVVDVVEGSLLALAAPAATDRASTLIWYVLYAALKEW